MKKLYAMLLALSLLVTLAACGNANTPAETTEPPAAEPGFVFDYNGTKIEMNAPAESIVTALGEPVSFTEQTSCAFTGLDKTYYYGSFYMDTYPGEDGDYVYSLWLADDTVTTAEGLYIGAAAAQVEAIYGAEGYNGTNAYILTKGDSRLTIILEEGIVTSIQYDAIIN